MLCKKLKEFCVEDKTQECKWNLDVDGKFFSIYLEDRFINVQEFTGDFLDFICNLYTSEHCVEVDVVDDIITFKNTSSWSVTIKPNRSTSSVISLVGFKCGTKLFQIDLYEDYTMKPLIRKYSNIRYEITEVGNRRYLEVMARVTKDNEFMIMREDITKRNFPINIMGIIKEKFPYIESEPDRYWL